MEVCGRLLARDNEVTIRRAPAHGRVAGNVRADEFAKAAARRPAPCFSEAVPDELLSEASLSHMSRSATEARSRASAEWSAGNVRPERRYRPLPGRDLRRQHRRSTKSWPGGSTTSSPSTQRSDRTLKTRCVRLILTRAGFATPASVSPDSTSWPGARPGPARREPCGRESGGSAKREDRWPRRCRSCSVTRERRPRC